MNPEAEEIPARVESATAPQPTEQLPTVKHSTPKQDAWSERHGAAYMRCKLSS